MLGLGVMIQHLGGNEESVVAMKASIGETIKHVEITSDDQLSIQLANKTTLTFTDEGQSCCEHRYMSTDDDLKYYFGAELLGAEIREGGSKDSEYGECLDSEFLVVQTSKGDFTIVNYNEHNGYYGGFWVTAKLAVNSE